MRSMIIVTGLLLAPGAAFAGGSEFCLTGTTGAGQQNINCASRWVSADGTQMGPMADPRHTPKTPYNQASSIWSGSQYGTKGHSLAGNSLAGSHTGSSQVWQGASHGSYGHGSSYGHSSHGASSYGVSGGGYVSGQPTVIQAVPSAAPNQVLVTRGAGHNTIYTGNWGSHYEAPAPYSMQAPGPAIIPQQVVSTASWQSSVQPSLQGSSLPQISNGGCFSYGAGGQSVSVPCSGYAGVTGSTYSSGTNTSYGHGQSHFQGCGHAMIAPAPMPVSIVQHMTRTPVMEAGSNGFYNSLNGGVGYDTPVYSGGGGGGVFVSSGSTSVLGRAPVLRMRSANKGKGGHMNKKHHGGGHGKKGCGGCGTGHGKGHGGH